MNSFFLLFSVMVVFASAILFLSRIDDFPFWTKKTYIFGSSFLIGLILLTFSTRAFMLEENRLTNQLLANGVSYTLDGIPYNTPVIKKKIIIEDGSDLIYYEIIKGENK